MASVPLAGPAGSGARASTERVVNAIPVALALFDLDGRLTLANPRARSLLGLDEPSRPVEETIDTVLAPLLGVVQPLVRTARAGLTPPPALARFRGAQGESIAEVTVGALADGSLLVSATDITARESLLEALERRARELAAIFEVSPSSVRVLDAEGHIVRTNALAVREHPGERPRTLAELIARDQPCYPATKRPLRDALHPGMRALAGELVRDERYIVRRGPDAERRIVEVHAAPVRDGARQVIGAVLVSRDITEQHRLADELAEQVARTAELNERVSTEAERLDRMVDERSRELLALQESRARERRLAAVGQLAAGVMHDVNNALNPIMAAAWLLEHHAADPDAVRDYARRIARAAETGAATAARVGRFLRQEPIDAGTRRLVDLAQVADEVLQLTEPLIAGRSGGDARIALQRDFAAGVTIHGLAAELREAVFNLVQNAIDAMPAGGTLTLRARRAEALALLEIADTGIGMSDDVRDRAFEPFFSTKGVGGSGLGLAEVYGIVRRHRGRVEIESAPGRGTSVLLRFPHAATAPVVDEAALPRATQARRLLVVEDHDDGREFLRWVLQEDGHAVDAVATLAEARTCLGAPGASYDVLITDVGLPDGSGWELVGEARLAHPSMHVGVVTGWEPLVHGAGAGAADFIMRKPLRAAELLASLARLEASPESRTNP
jgi:PAS domain S-box-containing protein